jgi:isoleucyl-tRNA synthetase
MMELNATINWCPPEVGTNRFHNWLKDAKPWCVARNRYFGTGIAVWESEDGEEMMCIGSVDELMEHAVNLTERPTDIHPEFINDIVLKSPTSGKLLKRVPFVFDCWFESGCVPYAQIHYPFENKELIDDCGDYLCDFIAEGLDQCRGWYYTLMVLSSVISNKPPAKNIMCTGLILDETGLKFSKKYGNFVDPSELITKYGADVLRLYLLSSPVVHAEPLLFSEKEVLKVKQRITLTLPEHMIQV